MTEHHPRQTPPTTLPPPTSPPTTAWAIAALIFGIIGASLIGIICGAIALTKTKTGQFGGRTLAIAGLILSGVWLIIGIIAIVAMLALSDDSESSTAGGQYVPEVGTCFSSAPDGKLNRTDAVSCDTPHKAEVFAVFTIPGDQYPGDTDKYIDRCASEFAQYAAEDAAGFDIRDLEPSEDSWAQGHRSVVCFAASDDPVTGSVKG